MNSLKTLYFPGTAVPSLRLYPLFLLFHNLHFLAAVEPDPATDHRESADSFTNWGFCQVHTPRPLGTDRQRFTRLVADITSHGPDYTSQLASLTLASITERGAEESERAIVNSLMPTAKRLTETTEDQERDAVWRARLLLAIGEILDREEEEVVLSLAMFEDDEKRLFQELQGEDDREEIDALLGGLARLDGERRGNSWSSVKQRCQAWKWFYNAMDDIDFPIVLARTRESGEVLRQDYEQRHGIEAASILTLPLPTVVGRSGDEAQRAVRRFIDDNAPALAAMASYFETLLHLDPLTAAQAPPSLAPHLVKSWQDLLDRDFPEERFGRTPLTFYLFPGWPTPSLLDHPEKHRTTTAGNGLLAALG